MHRNGVRSLAAAAALAVVPLAGCGEENAADTGAGGNAGQSPATDTPTPSPGEGGAEPPHGRFEERARQVADDWPDARTGQDSPDQGLWSLEGMLPAGPADRTLTVEVGHGACDLGFGALVHETGRLVIVSGWAVPDPAATCTEQLVVDEVEVSLDAELGSRTVVDAVSGGRLGAAPGAG